MAGAHHVPPALSPGAEWIRADWTPRSVGPVGGWNVWQVADTGSTNADLLDAARRGAPDRTVLVAGHQTSGRGRLDRTWEAPPGANLLVSVLFRDPAPTDLIRRVALALVGACQPRSTDQVMLKWPNDVLLGASKVAGVLAERAGGATVVGIGLNIGWAPEGAARIAGGDPATMLAATLSAYDALPADIEPLYRSRLATLGRRVRVELFGSQLIGTAIRTEPDGSLVVVDDCAINHRIDAGDVVHLRAVDAASSRHAPE